MTSSLTLTLHRPSVPSPLNPTSSTTTTTTPQKRRRIITPRRPAHLSPGQRLLRRKASEAYNAQIITTSLAAAPVPPRRPSIRPTLQRSPTASLISLIPEPLASFDDAESDSEDSDSSLVVLSKTFTLPPIAAILQVIPLPLLSLFIMRFPGLTGTQTENKEPDEEDCFLQAAADLEEGRVISTTAEGAALPLVLTMRRLFAAVGFLCLYALMQFEPLLRRPGRSYA